MPDTLTAEAMSTAQPAMSAFKTGLDWAQSFAQNTLKAQQNEMMRQQTQQMQDELNMKKGQWLASNMTRLALMPEGKLKNGLVDSFYENAQKAGMSLHPTVGDAIHDPATAPMIANLGQTLGQADPGHAPFYGAYAKYYGAYGEFDPQKMAEAASSLQQVSMSRKKFGQEETDKTTAAVQGINDKYRDILRGPETVFNSMPMQKDDKGRPIKDTDTFPKLDFSKMGHAEDLTLANALLQNYDKQKDNPGSIEMFQKGSSWIEKAQKAIGIASTEKGALFDDETRKSMYDLLKTSYKTSLQNKKDELTPYTKNQFVDPTVALSPKNQQLLGMNQRPSRVAQSQAPASPVQAQTAPEQDQTASASGTAGQLFQLSPKTMQKWKGKSQSDIEAMLGQKLPPQVSSQLGAAQ